MSVALGFKLEDLLANQPPLRVREVPLPAVLDPLTLAVGDVLVPQSGPTIRWRVTSVDADTRQIHLVGADEHSFPGAVGLMSFAELHAWELAR